MYYTCVKEIDSSLKTSGRTEQFQIFLVIRFGRTQIIKIKGGLRGYCTLLDHDTGHQSEDHEGKHVETNRDELLDINILANVS